MTKLNQLPKIVNQSKKRIGRGIGSGRGGHTVGRGQKGQRSRGKVKLGFAGTKTKKSLLKRLPLLRGKGKLKSKAETPLVINLKYLNFLPDKTEVTVEALVKHGIISKSDEENPKVKILGEGKIEKALTICLPISRGARKKIEKAGGKVVLNE
jgi:large subunit ribosomal protein L15